MYDKVVVIGNFTIDNVVTAGGKVFLRKAGGNALHSAIGAHVWTNEVGIFSSIPINYPPNYLEELVKADININGIKKVIPAVDLEEWFFYDNDGSRLDRLYTSKDRSRIKIHDECRLTPSEKQALLLDIKNNLESGVSFADFRMINPLSIETIDFESFPSKACHIAPNNFKAQLSIASGLKMKGVFISLDPPFVRSAVDESELAELLQFVDCFLPSLKELKALYPDIEPIEAIHRLSKMGPLAIGVKLGNQGSLVWSKKTNNIGHVSAYQTDCVVDLTGAGDAYCSGFLVGMQETGDPFVAAKYGSVTSSLVIEQPELSSKLKCNRAQAMSRLGDIEVNIA